MSPAALAAALLLALAWMPVGRCAAEQGVAPGGADEEAVAAPGSDAGATAALASGIDLSLVDDSIPARSDLFRHANGRWLAHTRIPPDRANYGIDAITQDRVEDQLHALVAELAVRQDLPADSTPAKIALLYREFMDRQRCNRLGLAPLHNWFARIGGIERRAQLGRLFGEFTLVGIDLPLELDVAQDERDASRYRIHAQQGGLSLPDRDYYLDRHDARLRAIRKAFLVYAEDQFRRLHAPDPAGAAHQVLAFETRIARAQWDRVANRDPLRTYNPRTPATLRQELPHLYWRGWLQALGVGDDPGLIVVGQPSYVSRLDRILAGTPLPVLKTWLRWQVLRSYAPLLDDATAQRAFRFESGVLRGVPQQLPRWKRGLDLIDATLGDGLGQLYVERHFPPEAKARIEALVSALVEAFRDSIERLEWMTPATRSAALDKLAHVHAKLAYPEHWRDYRLLELVPGDLLASVESAVRFESRRQLDRLAQPVDRDEWDMTPQTVNAYYNPTLNEIVFPAAQLQAPYFDPRADDAANYGGIGCTIGHELSHAFDDEGSQYDAQGNLRDWWTRLDRLQYHRLTLALVQQYSRVSPLPGLHVNGRFTLGENIADNVGMTIAWKAYQASLQGSEAPVIDGMSGAQRFFISYAQSWLGKQRDADLVQQLKSDPHAPYAVRANLPARNQDAFHTAFGTAPGDGMWLPPQARVHLW